MPKYIRLEPAGGTYRLPAETKLDDLREEIQSAHSARRSAQVEVEMTDNPLTTGFLVLNPSLPAFLLVELPEDVAIDALGPPTG
jgi:hypothetical protein